jgi:hypothetical protein
MPYTIRTKDGIEIPNVPDNVDKNSPQARALVQAERVKRASVVAPVTTPSTPSVTQPKESGLARGLGLVGRAVAPYAAAAGAGAAAGAPFAGVGAIPGAIAGVGAYGLAQLADALAMGGEGQQAVERGLTAVGFPEPQTATENIGIAGIRGARGAGGTAATAANVSRGMELARMLQGTPATTTQRVTQALGARPDVQAISGGTGAATAQGARELGLPEPVAITAGVVGGMAPYTSVGGMQRSAEDVATAARDTATAVRNRGTQPQRPRATPTAPTAPMPPNEIRRGNVQRLENEGIPISPGQRSGAPLTQTMESTMAYLPGSTGQTARFQDLQQRAYTRALLRRAGIDSDVASQEVLREGRNRFNQAYDYLEQNTRLMGGSEPLFNRLAQVESQYGQGFSDQMKRTFRTMRDDLLNWAAGTPRPGQTYQRMQEELSSEISKAGRSDAPGSERYQQALLGLRRGLTDLMEENTPPEIAQQWRRVNREYAIFKTIEEAMLDPAQRTINSGFVNPRVIAREQKLQLPDEWTRGDPDVDSFTNLVKAGAGIIPDPIPNSGTAQRMFAQDLLTGGREMFGLGGGDPLQRVSQAVRGGVGTTASVGFMDPVLGVAIPNIVSRSWFRQPQQRGPVAIPAATESTKQRQKSRRERLAEMMQRSN